jgi:hypothetical protein
MRAACVVAVLIGALTLAGCAEKSNPPQGLPGVVSPVPTATNTYSPETVQTALPANLCVAYLESQLSSIYEAEKTGDDYAVGVGEELIDAYGEESDFVAAILGSLYRGNAEPNIVDIIGQAEAGGVPLANIRSKIDPLIQTSCKNFATRFPPIPERAFSKRRADKPFLNTASLPTLAKSTLPNVIPSPCFVYGSKDSEDFYLGKSGFADVNGDGVADLIGLYQCFNNGNGDGLVQILDGASPNPQTPNVLATLDLNDPKIAKSFSDEGSVGFVASTQINSPYVMLYLRYWQRDRDPNCCSFGRRAALFKFENEGLSLVEVRELDSESEDFYSAS